MTILIILIWLVVAFSGKSSQVLNRKLLLKETKCPNDFTLNENSKCVQFFDEKCLEPSCNNCSNGFYSFNGFCLQQSVENCMVYEFNTNICEELTVGFRNAYSLYASPDENCTHKTLLPIVSFCISCQEGYYRTALLSWKGRNCVKHNVPNCEDYVKDSPLCQRCMDGFNVFNGFCTSHVVTPNCQHIDANSGECILCKNLFSMQSDNTCVALLDEHCKMNIDNQNVCIKCFEGYESIDGECQKSRQRNCLSGQLNRVTNICKKCESLYYPNGSRCSLVTAESCLSSDGLSNRCSSCTPRTEMDPDGNCILRTPLDIPNCISDLYLPECTKCLNLFYLDERGRCSPVTAESCLSSDGLSNRCSSCTPRMEIDPDGNCILRTPLDDPNCISDLYLPECTKCLIFFYPDERGRCSPITDQNCTYSNGKVNICHLCNRNYWRIYYTQKFCVLLPPEGCPEIYKRGSICIECQASRYLNSNRHCQLFNYTYCDVKYPGTSVCKICQDNYYLTENLTCARQNLNRCIAYKSNENICTACGDNYNLAAGLCWYPYELRCRHEPVRDQFCQCIPNHRQDSPTSACTQIEAPDGYTPGCRDIKADDLTCGKTYNGFWYDDTNRTRGIRRISIENCVFNINLRNECKVCEPGYYRNDENLCVPF